MLFAQFVTSGRFEILAGRIGLDVMMGFHRFAARILLALVVLHVAIALWPATRVETMGVSAAFLGMVQTRSLTSGFGAALLLIGVVILAVRRNHLPIRYEVWRGSHGAAAVGTLLLALDHAWRNAVMLQFASVAAAIAAGAGAALAAAFSIYILRWLKQRNAWIVEQVQPEGGRLHQVTLRQVSGPPFAFRAGQFVWVSFGGRHPIGDHPFSIASSPDELPHLRLLVKENGDFTGTIGGLAKGTRASLDGPHGNFVASRREAVLLIAGGVGIAPIIGILRDLTARAYRGRVALLIATRTAQEQIFRTEIAQLATKLDLHAVFCVEVPDAEWDGALGRVDEAKLRQLLAGIAPEKAEVLLCGPAAMITATSEALLRLGLPLRRIRYERFDYDEAGDPKSRQMRRFFLALFLAIGAGLFLTALSAARDSAQTTDGAAAFARACGGCHSIGRWQGANAIGMSPQRRVELEAFLSRHHAPDPAVRRAIIDYLAAQSR
jgi:predicted ferric reductase